MGREMNIKVGDIVSYHDKDESESVRWYAIVTQINETIILVHGLDGGNTTAILPGEITAVWSCPEEMRAVKKTAFALVVEKPVSITKVQRFGDAIHVCRFPPS